MKTLYISDLDGTLLNSQAQLSKESRIALKNLIDNGLNFTVATARSPATVVKILEGSGIRLPAVLMNGVIIYDLFKDSYIKWESIPKSEYQRILSAMDKNNIKGFVYTIENNNLKTYYSDLSEKPLYDFYHQRKTLYKKPFTKADFHSLSNNVIYITMIDRFDRLKPVYDALDEGVASAFYEDIYSKGNWYLEIFSNKASKKNGVKYIKELISCDRVVAFGDNLNDLPMFEASDFCCAVENANKAVKEKADFIIPSNQEDGVIKYLEEKVKA